MSNYATRKELYHATGVDTSDLTSKKKLIALKAEDGKLDINKLVNVPTNLNNLKAKLDDLNIAKLKTVPVDLKKLSDVVDNEAVKRQEITRLWSNHDKLGWVPILILKSSKLLFLLRKAARKSQHTKEKSKLLRKKCPDASALIHINQYSTG